MDMAAPMAGDGEGEGMNRNPPFNFRPALNYV